MMIAVIKGDIIASRKLDDAGKWLNPLKNLLGSWGQEPRHWELVWGDSFQLEVGEVELALHRALSIKALIKRIKPLEDHRKISTIDVRMAIGIGEKTFSGRRISESNGPAFVYAGERFEELEKKKQNMLIGSPWPDFDEEMNLYLRLAGSIMDHWSVSSAELIDILLSHPESTQADLGRQLGIRQNSVSGRWSRAKADDILEIEKMFRTKIKQRI